jgi:predicted RNA binding protein YcfA (HicA-like mRNA interferase family)
MSGFAGSLRSRNGGAVPPPDALAFYLPFHYFYPKWWGIYLIAEGVLELAKILRENSNYHLSLDECWHAARIFLWGHEQYHLCVESFATRLEVTHRKPLYRDGFERYYRQTANSDQWIEEALATAYGMERCERAFQKDRQDVLRLALMTYVESTPPGYNKAPKFLGPRFKVGQQQLAEDSHRLAVPNAGAKPPALWATFPHGFHPFRRINSRVCFLVHRHSYLAERTHLNLRYLTYPGLKKRLEKIAQCRFLRNGKGSHEIWKCPCGRPFPVPRHPGDLARGTLAKIIKQAGLDMSVEQFIGAI